MATAAWSALVLIPAISGWVRQLGVPAGETSRFRLPMPSIVSLTLLIVLGTRVADQFAIGSGDILKSFGASTRGANALTEHLLARPGPVAFLIPENMYRPLTVDSAIYKGGTNEVRARWGDSPYVYAMFPDRHYVVDGFQPGRDPDLGQFNQIVFVRLPKEDGDIQASQRLRDHFGLWLQSYDCNFRADVIDQEIVACERRETTLSANDRRVARFVSRDRIQLAVDNAQDQPTNLPTTWLAASERAYGPGLQLWQIRPDGTIDWVEAPDGTQVRIEDVGAWNPATQALTGLTSTSRGGRFMLDANDLEATNTNPTFSRAGTRRQPLLGWQIQPRDPLPSVEYLSDESGPFVRLRPVSEDASIVVYNRAPLSRLEATPITVRAVVRAHGPKPVTLTISDVVARGGEMETRAVATTSSDSWETLSVWLNRASFPDDRDSFSVKLADPVFGSWMDLREVSVIQGIVP